MSRRSGRDFGYDDDWDDRYERQSNTRSTARGKRDYNDNYGSGHFGGARFFSGSGSSSSAEVPNNTFSPSRSQGSIGTTPSTSGRSFGGGSNSGATYVPQNNNTTSSNLSSGSGHFGGRR